MIGSQIISPGSAITQNDQTISLAACDVILLDGQYYAIFSGTVSLVTRGTSAIVVSNGVTTTEAVKSGKVGGAIVSAREESASYRSSSSEPRKRAIVSSKVTL